MNEHGQHVVLAADDRHIILEARRIHFASASSKHLENVVLQPFVVHLDIVRHSVVGTGRGPETAAAAAAKCLHHRIGVEHRQLVAYLIAIIPLLQFVEVHTILLSQGAHLVFREAEEPPHIHGLYHRELREIVQCRLGLVLLNG